MSIFDFIDYNQFIYVIWYKKVSAKINTKFVDVWFVDDNSKQWYDYNPMFKLIVVAFCSPNQEEIYFIHIEKYLGGIKTLRQLQKWNNKYQPWPPTQNKITWYRLFNNSMVVVSSRGQRLGHHVFVTFS